MNQKLATGIDLIAHERQRQVEAEGWTQEHDDHHTRGELARAALVYIADEHDWCLTEGADVWPWDDQYLKMSEDPIRNLVKAGALIAAEIDRRIRKQNWPIERDDHAAEPYVDFEQAAAADAEAVRALQEGVGTDLYCQNFGGSASLPLEMTCDDHQPRPIVPIDGEGEAAGQNPHYAEEELRALTGDTESDKAMLLRLKMCTEEFAPDFTVVVDFNNGGTATTDATTLLAWLQEGDLGKCYVAESSPPK